MASTKGLLQSKFKHISDLEKRVNILEAETDKSEYSRRPNLRFQGLPEADGQNKNELVLQTIKEKMEMKLSKPSLERSQLLGPKKDTSENRKKRAIVIRFRSEAIEQG